MADAVKPKKPSGGSGGAFPFELGILILVLLFVLYQILPVLTTQAYDVATNTFVTRLVISLKIISGLISLVATVGIIYVVTMTNEMRPRISARITLPPEASEQEDEFVRAWDELHKRLEGASDTDAPYLIIQADALIDKALKRLRLPGETMGERLKSLDDQNMKSLDGIWEAHKMRNEIAHEGGHHIRYSDAVYAIQKFEAGLKELGVI